MADTAAPPRRGLPVVAVVGRPNVGKSSLVNRILGRREAIVNATPGVTRDRAGFVAEWNGRTFEIVDTGGLEPGQQGLDARVAEQAQIAIETADVIVLVVDTAAGPNQDDLEVAELLRRSDKPVLVAANKADDPGDEPSAAAFYRLGLGDPVPLSALHGRGSGDFLEELVALLPDAREGGEGEWASLALVGRPNVGKSSLLNALAGVERAIVDPVPGTTRDPVDTLVDHRDTTLRIVDTAGMRKRTGIDDEIEYFAWLRSRRTLSRVDVAVLVIDAGDGVTGLDQRLAHEIAEEGRACVIILNKWDLVASKYPEGPDRDRFDRDVAQSLRWLDWAPLIRTSAHTKRGVAKILDHVATAVESHRRRLPTAEVNRVVADAQAARPHPRSRGRGVRILYAVQAGSAPPTIVLFANAQLEDSYVRYIENRLREHEPWTGSPLRLVTRIRRRPDRP